MSELKELQKMLQKAVTLELSTIPPYLTSMYSIQPGTNPEAYAAIRSVVMEEMLHMLLAANVLSAIGGKIKLGKNDMPKYPLKTEFRPAAGKHEIFDIPLASLSMSTLEIFLKIEQPQYIPRTTRSFENITIPAGTVGHFYAQICERLEKLTLKLGKHKLFSGPTERQVTEQYYWGAGGKSLIVTDLTSALKAISMIVDQGEGNSADAHVRTFPYKQDQDRPHYYRFFELKAGKRFLLGDLLDTPTGSKVEIEWDSIYPLKPDYSIDDFKGQPELVHLDRLFNLNYTTMLQQIEEGFSGNRQAFYPAILNCMRNLSSIASSIVQIPLKKYPQYHAAPRFAWAG